MKYKIAGILILLIIFVLGFFYSKFEPAKEFEWGINFSPRHAEYLGFDWKTMYIDILNDLHPKKMRLMAYWEDIEPVNNKYDFQEMDEMLIEAGKRNMEIILVVGRKQPRWPECHQPAWYKDLSRAEQDSEQLEMISSAVGHFKIFKSIKFWQVENEPFFNFGPQCPTTDREFLKREIDLVRSLDQRPVIITDSGELGRWVPAARIGPDVLGSTMYRLVHSPKIGYFRYPLPPAFFRIKAGITQQFSNVTEFMGVELQAEPWFEKEVFNTDIAIQNSLMNARIFEDNINYAKKVGFRDNYLWGVEWWYWQAKKNNDWGMWEAAKKVLRK